MQFKAFAISVLLVACSLGVALSQQSLNPQATSLLLLRGAIGGNGALSSWNPSSDVCSTWKGITCDDSGNVVGINLQDEGLTGQIPLDEGLWTSLDTLKNFNVAGNRLTGFIPPQMSVLSNLEYLSMSDNELESVLPGSWQSLSGMKGLDVSGNKLYGDLPDEWSTLSNLQALDLSRNDLSGTIPASWASLPALQAASLADNPQLCADNPNANRDPNVAVYYGPCDPTSPQLPDINPYYPPAPKPAPQPTPEPAVAPKPVSPPVPAPPPIEKRPESYIDLRMSVTGGIDNFYDSLKYREVVARAAKVLPAWVEVTGVSQTSVTPSQSRRLLQEIEASEITNQIFTNDQDQTIDNLNQSIDDGSLAEDLEAELGVILVPGSALATKPSSTNVGAIVGGVVGGVCGLIIALVIVWFVVKKKKCDGAHVTTAKTGEKSGAAMWSDNQAFSGEGEPEEGMAVSKKEDFKRYDGAMYEDAESTPRTGRSRQQARTEAAFAKGVNPLSLDDRKDSDLSDPDSARYATPSVSSAPMTARSRLDSARSGLESNPLFTPREVADSDEEDGNNPTYAKSTARSGRSTEYGSARTGGIEIDSSRKYESANESGFNTARTNASMQSNPLGNLEEDEDADGGNNPLFNVLGGKKK
jgi:hypothetical protein